MDTIVCGTCSVTVVKLFNLKDVCFLSFEAGNYVSNSSFK